MAEAARLRVARRADGVLQTALSGPLLPGGRGVHPGAQISGIRTAHPNTSCGLVPLATHARLASDVAAGTNNRCRPATTCAVLRPVLLGLSGTPIFSYLAPTSCLQLPVSVRFTCSAVVSGTFVARRNGGGHRSGCNSSLSDCRCYLCKSFIWLGCCWLGC